MQKIFKLFLLVLILFSFIIFPGCMNSEDEIDPTIKEIKNAGKLIVGTSTPYEPMEYADDQGKIVGFDIDLAQEIASSLDVELEIKDMDFDLLLDSVVSGDIDIAIAAITINVERSEKVLFSNPYLNAGQVIVVNDSNADIKSPEDLNGSKVGVENGTTSQQEAEKYTNSSLVIDFDNYSAALDGLVRGEVQAIIIDYPAGFGLVRNNEEIKVIGNPFTDELYGVAIKKGETSLKNKIDEIINSGTIDVLKDKWF